MKCTRINYRVLCVLGAITGMITPLTGGAAIGDGNLESGELTLGGRFSDQVQEIFTDVLVPLFETETTVLHLNLRGTFLEGTEQEMNSGLVFRHILQDHDVILGANLFYDSRWTEQDHYFDQVGAGIEMLTDNLDFRANYYHPLEDTTQTISEGSSTDVQRRSTSTRRITTTTTTFFKTFEEAMDGFDVELGGPVPLLSDLVSTRAFVGYYEFNSDFGNDVEGWKFRAESMLCEFVTLDAEWFEDKVLNSTDFFVGLRMHIPLDFWNGITGRERSEGLPGRMREMVIRDFRVRTAETDKIVVGTTVVEEVKNIPPPEEPAAPPPPPICDWPHQGDQPPFQVLDVNRPILPVCPPPPCWIPRSIPGGGLKIGASLDCDL